MTVTNLLLNGSSKRYVTYLHFALQLCTWINLCVFQYCVRHIIQYIIYYIQFINVYIYIYVYIFIGILRIYLYIII